MNIRCGLATLALVLVSRGVSAESRLRVKLEYHTDPALESCPSDADFRALIAKQLEYDPFRTASAHQVVARAEPFEQGIRGSIRWYDADGAERGERELRATDRDCAAFAKAMSFAIAVQVQLLNTERELAAEDQAAKSPPAPPPRAVAPPVTKPRDDRPPRDSLPRATDGVERGATEYLLGLGPGVIVGSTPQAAAAGRVFGAVRRGRLGLELGAEASLPSRRRVGSGQGFEQRLALGSLAGCASLSVLIGCVVQKLGALEVRGFGVDVPREPVGLLAQTGLRLAAGDRFGSRWYGALRVEALATLTRWEVLLNEREVWKVPPVSLALGGDLGVIFQ